MAHGLLPRNTAGGRPLDGCSLKRTGNADGTAEQNPELCEEPYYKVEITGNGIVAESERMAQEQDADIMQAACDGQCAVVGSIERKRKEQSAPKLYDLATLQQEANRYYGFTASQTLKIVQELYEEKAGDIPANGQPVHPGRYAADHGDLLKHYGSEADGVKQVVNNKRFTDHHAILPTLESCKRGSNSLSGDKEKVFALIVWKMQQAVQPSYIYEDVLVTVCCQGQEIHCKLQKCLAGGIYRNACSFCRTGKKQGYGIPQETGTGRGDSCGERGEKAGLYIPAESIYRRYPAFCNATQEQQKEFEKDTEKGLGNTCDPCSDSGKAGIFRMWNAKASRFFPVQRELQQSQISRIT